MVVEEKVQQVTLQQFGDSEFHPDGYRVERAPLVGYCATCGETMNFYQWTAACPDRQNLQDMDTEVLPVCQQCLARAAIQLLGRAEPIPD